MTSSTLFPFNCATTTSTPITTIPTTNTTMSTSTSTSSSTTTMSTSSTTNVMPVPDPDNREHFDGWSFFGGILLTLGIAAIGFVGFKYYKLRNVSSGGNYNRGHFDGWSF